MKIGSRPPREPHSYSAAGAPVSSAKFTEEASRNAAVSVLKPKDAASLQCFHCQRVLTRDEIALTRKLINRGTQTFFCLSCLAAHFQVTEDILREKIIQFREMGCTLFDP